MSNTTSKTEGHTRDDECAVDSARRSLALSLLGALGASAMLKGCTSGGPNSDTDEQPGSDAPLLRQTAQALNGITDIRWFDTVAAMRAFSVGGAQNYTAIVHGYSAPADLGGGIFIWSTTPAKDDGKPGTALYSGVNVNPLVAGVIDSNPAPGWRRLFSGALDARWFGAKGDGAANDTDALQALLNASAGGVAWISKPPVKYRVGTLVPPPNTEVRFAPGCVLEATASLLGGGASSTTIPMFHITGVGDFKLIGRGATLQMDKANFSGQYNHCIYIQACTGNVVIEGLACNDSGGDGISVKSDTANVVLRDVLCNNNRRAGLAVTRCRSFEAYGCTFSGTTDVVKAGVDIEPDNATDTLGPIRFYACKAQSNNGSGFFIYLNFWQQATNVADIEFNGCQSENNGNSTAGTGAGFDVSRVPDVGVAACRGHIRFVNCTSKRDRYAGFCVFNKSALGPHVTIENCTVVDANQLNSGNEWQQNAISIYNDGVYSTTPNGPGGVTVLRPTVIATPGGGGNMSRAVYVLSQGSGHDNVDISDWTIVREDLFKNQQTRIGCGPAERRVRIRHHSPREVAYTTSITSEVADGRHRGDVISNRGATGIVGRILPQITSSHVGQYTAVFLVVSAQEVRIAPNAADTILGGGRTAGSLITSSTPGSRLRLQCTALNEWVVVEQTGSWA